LRVSGGFSGGLLPVLPVSRQKRPEGLSGGARNGCYVQFCFLHIIWIGNDKKNLHYCYRRFFAVGWLWCLDWI
ncbi:hypothetical protein, partial [Escherichia coli]|uniref:hypothetical protein n=1 Tax=Escherichia coli TaxID=562 RepID=UPI001C929860